MPTRSCFREVDWHHYTEGLEKNNRLTLARQPGRPLPVAHLLPRNVPDNHQGPDQAGCWQLPPPAEMRRFPVPSARMMYMALLPPWSEE